MATDTRLTATGNLTADPVLRFTGTGSPVASFTVACNDRRKTASGQWEDAGTLWLRCTAWDRLAEATADQLAKGDAVTVTGHLRPDDYERDGARHTGFQVQLSSLSRPIRPTSGASAAAAGPAAPRWTSATQGDVNGPQAAVQRFDRPPF
ncbi:single-stranded DNA-binding protein [Streptomyces sp. NPDC049555]|uniref:single-stranded DNA-binding protein n=1 Tax=Streptomyces sp. NPDC049555 TaxID=3154930 RepID=UPI00344525D6